jgi:hypothetical protein
MLGAVSLRLGQEKVRDQFAASAGVEGVDPESDLSGCAGSTGRSRPTIWSAVLTTPATKEST